MRAEIAIAPCRVPSSSAVACPAPVAQRIEHRPPEPVAQVRVLPGALTFSQIRRHFWKLCRLSLLKAQPSTCCLNAFAGKDSNGRKRYTSRTLDGTKKEAGIALAAFVTEVAKERTASSPAEAITVSHTLSKWLASRNTQLSPATTDRYRVAIKHVEPVIGSMRVSRLRPHHIEDLYGASVAEGQSGSSIRNIHWALRQSLSLGPSAWICLNHCHRRGRAPSTRGQRNGTAVLRRCAQLSNTCLLRT